MNLNCLRTFLVIFLIASPINALAHIKKDPCSNFVYFGGKNNFVSCLDQINKMKEGGRSNGDLSWFNDPKSQLKFLNNVSLGKSRYVSLAFELLPLLDGASTEVVLMSLGESIRTEPDIFLVNLKNHFNYVNNMGLLDSLVGPVGPQYVDNTKGKIIEIQKRIKAIKTVLNPEINDVKKAVLDELELQLRDKKAFLNDEIK